MAELLACRVCMATNVRLYNMHKYRLTLAFENLTGINLSTPDKYPRQLCALCAHMLLKCNHFQQRCVRTHYMFKHATMPVTKLSINQIESLSRPLSPVHTISSSTVQYAITIEPKPEDNIYNLKEEHTDQSNDEPLTEKINKKVETEYYDFEFDDGNTVKYTEFDTSFDMQEEEVELEYEPSYKTGVFEIVDESDVLSSDIEIVLLDKEEQIQEILNRKESSNYKISLYKCELCFKGFMTDVTFKNHMVRHDLSSGPHSCDVCHIRCPNRSNLNAHIKVNHARKYVCKLCAFTTKGLHKAKEHVNWHNGHLFTCKICSATFEKSTSYFTHRRMQHPSKFCCDICGESFVSDTGLKMHKKKVHWSDKSKLKVLFSCAYCDAKFNTIDALKLHASFTENGTCDESQKPCIECGDNFKSSDLLKEHQKTHQKDESVKCDDCDRTFVNERSFASHYQRVHLGVKYKSFYRQRDASSRMRSPVVCEICGKKCISKATLVYHQRIHTGEKPFQCAECPKRFSVLQRLQIHLRTHTGERPYKCTHCPKAFKHKAALNRHDRVHTGVKPYQCSHCPKAFSQSNSMKVHIRTVHLKMPAPYRSKRNKPTPTD